MEDRVKKFYEAMYGRQMIEPKEDFFFTHFERFEDHREDVVYRLLCSGKKLLDVGCGDGALVIKARNKFQEVHGIDVSESRIKRAKERAERLNLNDVHFLVSNVDQRGLPYEHSNFDAVTCVATLQHLLDPYFILGEFARVLAKGGTLVVEVPNIAYLPRRVKLLFGILPMVSKQVGWDGGTLHYFTMPSLCKLIEDRGFRVVQKMGSGIFASLRNWWPSLLTGDLIVKGIKF